MQGRGAAYAKLEQPASGYSIVGVAAVIGRSGWAGGAHVRVGITGVGDVAYRASGVEQALSGGRLLAQQPPWRRRAAAEGQTVASDIHADRVYRTQMAAVFTRRALEEALRRAGCTPSAAQAAATPAGSPAGRRCVGSRPSIALDADRARVLGCRTRTVANWSARS